MGWLLDKLLTPCGCESMNLDFTRETEKYDPLGNKITSYSGDKYIYDDSHHIIGEWNEGVAQDLLGNRMDF